MACKDKINAQILNMKNI